MRLRKTVYSAQKVCGQSLKIESENFVDVTHSQKRTFKGSKIARVQSITENAQAERIDVKLSWEAQRKRRKEERQRRRGI
jgi:hypothetical protein